MRQSDAVRLTLAYVLIAASAPGVKAKGVGPGPGESKAAATPADLPTRTWLDVARNVFVKIGKNRVIAVAAGLTFYGLLAIFPAVTALVSIYGLFANPATIRENLAQLSGYIPEGALSVVGDQVQRITEQGSTTLGFAFFSGLAVALWSANSGAKALFDALNVAYGTGETRGFIRLNLTSLLFTLSAILLALVALAATVVVPWILQHVFPGYAGIATVLRWVGVLIAIFIALFMLAALYRFGPALKKPAWRWVTPGSLFALVVLIVASGGFAFYTAHFGSYNKTYGTLGAAIGFMTWLWISSIVVMIGAEINAEVESQAKGEPPPDPQQRAGQARS